MEVLDKFLRVITQIQPLLLQHQANPPLLHCQGAKKHVDRLAFFIFADLINDHSVGYNLVSLDVGIEDRCGCGLFGPAAECRAEHLAELLRHEQPSNLGYDIGVLGTTIE